MSRLALLYTPFSHINQKYVGDMSQKNHDNFAGDAQGNPNSKDQKLGRSWPDWKVTPGPIPNAAAYKFMHEKQG
jgi:hypothetical protein